MESIEFISIRKTLKKTQLQMAQLLGVSVKAIHSYEQGWRSIPGHIERQILFLFTREKNIKKSRRECWVINKCPDNKKKECPAWEFKAGKICWFISGTLCSGMIHKSWDEKIKVCKSCEVFSSLL